MRKALSIGSQQAINLLFIIIVFITTRQVPFSFLSPLMNIALVFVIMLSLVKTRITIDSTNIIVVCLVVPLLLSGFYSFFLTDNDAVLVARFLIILFSIGLAYFVSVNTNALKWFIWLCVLQALILIVFAIYIRFIVGFENYLPVRAFFLEKGWGDIYTYDGFFYRIQLKGSALLLVALILCLETEIIKHKKTVSIFLIVGIILAGNFAFLIAAGVYSFYLIFRLRNKKSLLLYQFSLFVFLGIFLLFLPYLYEYVLLTLENKRDDSLGARYDQVEVLLNDQFSSLFSGLLGQGLGNTIAIKTEYRDYTGLSYYELQVIYVFNQLGILFSSLFLLYNVLIVAKKWGEDFYIIVIYIVYIIYSVTNPYILDTNHFIVIVVLNSLLKYDREKRSFGGSGRDNTILS